MLIELGGLAWPHPPRNYRNCEEAKIRRRSPPNRQISWLGWVLQVRSSKHRSAGDATTPALIAAVSNAAHWARSAEPIKETLESSAWEEFCLQRNYPD